MWSILLDAVALVLVFEGIMPFLSPPLLRRLVVRLNELDNGSVRFLGLASMVVGFILASGAPGEMWGSLLDAVAVALVLEGIMPFLSPSSYLRLTASLDELGDGSVRLLGLASMMAGVALLYLGD